MAKHNDLGYSPGVDLYRIIRKGLISIILLLTLVLLLSCQLFNSLLNQATTIQPIEDVKALCLKIETHSRPTQKAKLLETVRSFLEPLGVEIYRGENEVCDATMEIDVKLLPLGRSYKGGGESHNCYTGATVRGNLVFRGADAVRRFEINGRKEPPLNTSSCPTQDDAPYEHAWSSDVFLAIYELWGIKALPIAVGHRKYVSNLSFYNTIESLYEEAGPKAISTAPDLIEVLEGNHYETRKLALYALKLISGEDDDKDADAWRIWWDEQSVSLTQQATASQTSSVTSQP